jgi:hypothetical protein
MKLTLYKSLLTGKKTMLVASIGKCGYSNYKEIQIMFHVGVFTWLITDGYKVLKEGVHNHSLKSALNIALGHVNQLNKKVG